MENNMTHNKNIKMYVLHHLELEVKHLKVAKTHNYFT